MWIISTIDQLKANDRWHVEHYFQPVNNDDFSTSKYPTVTLGDLFTVEKSSVNALHQPEQPFHYIGIKNIENETGDLIGERNCLGKEIKSSSQLVQNGNVLYGRIRPLSNKVYLAKNLPKNTICSLEFYVVSASLDKVTPRILKAILSSSLVLNQVSKLIGGAAIPRIAIQDLASIRVPLIPIEKQYTLEKKLYAQDEQRNQLKASLERLSKDMENVLNNAWK